MTANLPTAIIDQYAAALADNDTDRILAMLSADIVLRSPFSTWRGADVEHAYRARGTAFQQFTVQAVIEGTPRAVLLWHAYAGGRQVEACEVLTITEHTIDRVDIFLRPADTLDVVFREMSRAWPDVRH